MLLLYWMKNIDVLSRASAAALLLLLSCLCLLLFSSPSPLSFSLSTHAYVLEHPGGAEAGPLGRWLRRQSEARTSSATNGRGSRQLPQEQQQEVAVRAPLVDLIEEDVRDIREVGLGLRAPPSGKKSPHQKQRRRRWFPRLAGAKLTRLSQYPQLYLAPV